MEAIWRNARRLRIGATGAELKRWRHLKGRQLDGCTFTRRFPIAGYIVDFVCGESGWAIELDGASMWKRRPMTRGAVGESPPTAIG